MFTHDEIEMLFEALDALESSKQKNAMMGGMLGLMLSKDRDEAERNFKEKMESASPDQILKERIILLKAKLISMKDRAFVDGVTAEISNL